MYQKILPQMHVDLKRWENGKMNEPTQNTTHKVKSKEMMKIENVHPVANLHFFEFGGFHVRFVMYVCNTFICKGLRQNWSMAALSVAFV